MVLKCYQKPNRSKKRVFRTCDVVRIAREVLRDDEETTPEELLACIAKGLGFTHISLSRQRVLESVVLSKIPAKPTLAIIVGLLTKLALQYKLLSRYIGPILGLLKKLYDYIDKLERLFDIEQKPVDEVINKEKCNCKIFNEEVKNGDKK